MKVDLNEMIPYTRQEKFMYAIAERLEKLISIGTVNENIATNHIADVGKMIEEEKPKKKTTKKKTTNKKVDDKKDE